MDLLRKSTSKAYRTLFTPNTSGDEEKVITYNTAQHEEIHFDDWKQNTRKIDIFSFSLSLFAVVWHCRHVMSIIALHPS